ncbi:MAG TPA: hypothetical protein ACHBZ9_15465 [Arsenophonus nasoniae]|uniref:hypothetical protein n=1 Tax=Arsenophonus nasoniae TaxID=638 RepID=UPI003879B4B1
MFKARLFILLSFIFINTQSFADVPKEKIPNGADCAAALSPNTVSQANPLVDLSLCDPSNARKAGLHGPY